MSFCFALGDLPCTVSTQHILPLVAFFVKLFFEPGSNVLENSFVELFATLVDLFFLQKAAFSNRLVVQRHLFQLAA